MRKNKRQPDITGRWFYPVQHFDFVVNHSVDDVVERLRQYRKSLPIDQAARRYIGVHFFQIATGAPASFRMRFGDVPFYQQPFDEAYAISGSIKPIDDWTCQVQGRAKLTLSNTEQVVIALLLLGIARLLLAYLGPSSTILIPPILRILLSLILITPIGFIIMWESRKRARLLRELQHVLYEPRKAKSKNAHQVHNAA